MLCWVDVESSGLSEREGHLLEVAIVITDDDLHEKAYASVVTLPVGISIDEMAEKLDPYVRSMHTKNGLIDDLRTKGVRRHEAEQMLVDIAQSSLSHEPPVLSGRCLKCQLDKRDHEEQREEHGGEMLLVRRCKDGSVFNERTDPAIKHTPLAGSTVPFDRRWLREHMPKLEGLFSHRHVDVSTITELAKRWAPEVYALRPKSTDTHRALDDVRGSIELLRWYRSANFVGSTDVPHALARLRNLGLTVSR